MTTRNELVFRVVQATLGAESTIRTALGRHMPTGALGDYLRSTDAFRETGVTWLPASNVAITARVLFRGVATPISGVKLDPGEIIHARVWGPFMALPPAPPDFSHS